MNKFAKTGVAAILIAAWGPARGHDLDHHHHHESYSAGEPGDPSKPSRMVEIAMSEMRYEPSVIEVKHGEQIRFVLRNVGREDHESLLATTNEKARRGDEETPSDAAQRPERASRWLRIRRPRSCGSSRSWEHSNTRALSRTTATTG
jgi:uncharacterized cupredoxin-like copper-binding protein